MDYSVFIDQILTKNGIGFHAEFSAYDMSYDIDLGWPVKKPDLEPGKFLVLHLQDFCTVRDNRVLEFEQIETHYGSDSHRVIVNHWNPGLGQLYSGALNILEFSSHNHGTAIGLADRLPQWQSILTSKRTGWQCLNGRMCQHRRRAVDILQHWPHGILSYGSEIPLAQCSYDRYMGCNNEQNFLNLQAVYGSTAVNIVTETLYDTAPGIVTEKTQMAIAAQQIPIVIGYQGIVQHCRDLGFDMFDDLVDTSYDSLPNDVRVEQALLRNQDLILGNIDLAPYQQRLATNRQFLLHQFPQQCRDRYQQQVAVLAKTLGTL